MAQDFLRYIASKPTSWTEAVYRLIVLLILVWGVIRIRRVETVAENTNTKVALIATVVPPTPVSAPPVGSP